MKNVGLLRRILAFALVLMLCVSSLPATFAEELVEESISQAEELVEAVVAEPAASEEPAEEAQVEEAPAQEAQVEETPVEEAPVEEVSEEAPVEEAPVEEAPVEEAPVEEVSEEAPVEETPVEEAPVEEAPVEETPVEEVSEEAPVEEVSEEVSEEEVSEEVPAEEVQVTVYFVYDAALYGCDEAALADYAAKGQGVKAISAAAGEKLSNISVPAQEGFVFGGWYKDAECLKKWNFGADTVGEKNLVLFARWEEAPVEEIPAEEIPAEEIPAEEIPAEEETPAEEIPAEEIPAEEIPAEEIPAEEDPEAIVEENLDPTGIRIYYNGVDVTGQTVQILDTDSAAVFSYELVPAGAVSNVAWASAATKVAIVNELTAPEASVTPMAVGTTKVTATTVNGKKATVTVKVVTDVVVTGIKIPDYVDTTLGKTNYFSLTDTYSFTADLTPSYASTDITWKSSKTSVAEIDPIMGTLTPYATGTVTLTATTTNGKKATLKLTIYDPDEVYSMSIEKVPESVSGIKENYIPLYSDTPLTLNLLPSGATNTITWSSSSSKIATVDAAGNVTPLKTGTVTITAKADNGKKATIKLTVYDDTAPYSVSLGGKYLDVELGSFVTLPTAVVLPSTASQNVTWSLTKNSKVACFDDTTSPTEVYGLTVGTATLTAVTETGSKKATMTVRVYDPDQPLYVNVTSSDPDNTFDVWDTTAYVTGAVFPTTALDQSFTWSSSNKKVAEVDENGYLTFRGVGKATITAKTNTGKKTDSVTITVTNSGVAATAVEVVDPSDDTKIISGTSQSFTMNWTLADNYVEVKLRQYPYYGAGDSRNAHSAVTWTSSNSKVASIGYGDHEYARILIHKKGTVTITAKADSGKKTTFKLVISDPYEPTGFTLSNPSTIEMYTTDSPVALTGSFIPSTASSEATFASSKTSVATVSSDGYITAVGEGTAKITITFAKLSKKTTVTVKVTDPTKPTGIELNYIGNYTMDINATLDLEAILSPISTADSEVLWATTNSAIAAVYPDTGDTTKCQIKTSGKEGSVTITATCKKNTKIKTTLILKVADATKPTSLTLDKSGLVYVDTHDTLYVTLTQNPVPTADSEITWTSSNAAIAHIVSGDKAGAQIEFLKKGTVTITAKAVSGGKTASFRISVSDPYEPTGIVINNESTETLNLGDVLTVDYTLLPEETAESNVTFKSSNNDVATVNAYGNVTGYKEGTVTITATCSKNNKYATFKVTVVDPSKPTDMEVDHQGSVVELDIATVSTYEIIAQLYPLDSALSDITWVSSNTKVVTVDSPTTSSLISEHTQTLNVIGIGTATIKATSAKQNLTRSFTVRVYDSTIPTSMTLDCDSTVEAAIGENFLVTATLEPADTATDTLTATSSNFSICDVTTVSDTSFMLEPMAKGTATITIKSPKSGLTQAIVVKVYDATEPTAIYFDESTLEIELDAGSVSLGEHVTVEPETAVLDGYSYTSSNTAVCTVDSATGVLAPVKEGTARITVKTVKAGATVRTAYITVKVVDSFKPTSISLNHTGTEYLMVDDSYVLIDPKTFNIAASMEPDTAWSEVTWTSSNTAVADVTASDVDDLQPVLTINGPGETTIKVVTKKGKLSASFRLVVTDATVPTDMYLRSYKTQADINDSFRVIADVAPYGYAQTTLTWTSSNTNVAKVTELTATELNEDDEEYYGAIVTPVGEGKAVITVKDSVKNLTCSFTLTVTNPNKCTYVTVDKDYLDIVKMDSREVTVTMSPTYTDSWIVAQSSNGAVATVTEKSHTGNVYVYTIDALRAGTTLIKFIAYNKYNGVDTASSVTASITVDVEKDDDGSEWDYNVISDVITIVGYKGEDGVITVPMSINGKYVTAIGAEAFKGSTVSEIYLSNAISSIDSTAFTGREGKVTVYVPAGNTTLYDALSLMGVGVKYYDAD